MELLPFSLKYFPEKLRKDPEMVYPEIKDSLEFSDTDFKFLLGGSAYRLIYKEGKSETDDWGSRSNRTTTTHITIALEVDEKCVFDFKMRKTVTDTHDMPLFHETMGEIVGFIEGPWVTAIPELMEKIKSYEGDLRAKRRAPQEHNRLQEDMKRFGLS